MPGRVARPSRARPAARQSALAQSDLDEFMSEVLAKRDENWKKLQQYVLDEHEKIDMLGPTGVPIWASAATTAGSSRTATSCAAP